MGSVASAESEKPQENGSDEGSITPPITSLEVTITSDSTTKEDAWEGDVYHALYMVRYIRKRYGFRVDIYDAFKSNEAHYSYCQMWAQDLLHDGERPRGHHEVGTEFESAYLLDGSFRSSYNNRVVQSFYRLDWEGGRCKIEWLERPLVAQHVMQRPIVFSSMPYVDGHGVLVSEIDI